MKTKVHTPILAYGTFGLHILENPTGNYGFVGTVPEKLYGITGGADALLAAVFAWLDECNIADKKELVPLLRNDIFTRYFNRNS